VNGFEKRRQALRLRVVQKTLELFSAQGIKQTTVAGIARHAGVSPVSIYNYFASKDGLVKAVVRYVADLKLQEAAELLSSRRPYLERLADLVFIKNTNLRSYHPELLQAISAPEDPDLRAHLESEVYPQAMQAFTAFLEEGRQLAYIRPELSVDSIQMFTEMFKYLAASRPHIFNDFKSNKNLINEIWRLYLYGIMGRETHPELLNLDNRP
jgi:TetR/AcrR family transcriptional regulator, cholesterol catabolism regulator